MSLNNEDEFGTRPATEEEMREWEVGNIRGVRVKFTGVRVDSRGNRINELTVVDDEFAVASKAVQAQRCECGVCLDCQTRAFAYMNRHQKEHRHQLDPRCTICQAQQKFKQEHPELVGKRVGVEGIQS
jgi:hypothetical protein